jgi:hypothetical protein
MVASYIGFQGKVEKGGKENEEKVYWSIESKPVAC